MNVIEEGEQEVECNHANAYLITEKSTKKRETDGQEPIASFYAIIEDKTRVVKTSNLKQSTGEMQWDAKVDEKYLEWNGMHANVSAQKMEISLDQESNLSEAFFDSFFLALLDMKN